MTKEFHADEARKTAQAMKDWVTRNAQWIAFLPDDLAMLTRGAELLEAAAHEQVKGRAMDGKFGAFLYGSGGSSGGGGSGGGVAWVTGPGVQAQTTGQTSTVEWPAALPKPPAAPPSADELPWICPVDSSECQIRRTCTDKCGQKHSGPTAADRERAVLDSVRALVGSIPNVTAIEIEVIGGYATVRVSHVCRQSTRQVKL